ncbi:MAG: alpha/beta fold hydrolase [Burkholderiaceae bacterium]
MKPGPWAGALWAGLLALGSALPAASAALTECRLPGLRPAVQCGVLERPLDPGMPEATRIEIHYVVVPALARRKLADPVFLLAGGPGQSAIDLAPQVMPLFARLNNRRDIVFVDQRGTGRSAPLACADQRRASLAEQADPSRQASRLLDCLQRLQALPYGDLRQYTTSIAVQDLDAVRADLGAAQINLVGASYGTRVALEYQRQFPQSLRRSVLDGVAPPDMDLVASGAIDSRSALDAMFAACSAEAACHARYPRLHDDWKALLASLPKSIEVEHPMTGAIERLTFTPEMLLGIVRGPLYAPSLAAALPAAIDAATRGDWRGLTGVGSLLQQRRGAELAMGMHLSVVCAEDRASLGVDRALAESADEGAARLYRQVCAAWPRGDVSAGFYAMSSARSPVLLLSGGLDPATPPRHAERVARALGPLARHTVVANAGHGVMALPCLRDAVFRFIDAADAVEATGVDLACARDVPRPPAYLPLTGGSP